MQTREVRKSRRRATRLGVVSGFVAALVLVALPAAGLGSPAAGGARAQQPPGVEISHGTPVKPSRFEGDVRALPQVTRRNRRYFPNPRDSNASAQKQAPAETPALPAATAANMPTPSTSFKGLDFDTWGAGWPPDTVGDVGPHHFIQAVNTSIGMFSKAGTQLAAFTFDSFWSGAGTGTACDSSHQGNPTVVYDPMADRWIVADLAFTGSGSTPPFYECIAVSQTSDPVAGGWYFYAIRTDDAAHPWFTDYPKMGIWPDGLYMSANLFLDTTYEEVRVWAFNRADLESGAPVRSVVVDLNTTAYFSMLPSNLRGDAPPAGRPNFFVSESQTTFAFEVFKFHVDYSGSGSTFTGPTDVSQTAYTVAAATVPSPGNTLDSLRERLMMQAQYRNLSGTESVWVNHTVRTPSSGPTGIQWAQIDVTGGTVMTTPVQQQVYGNLGGDGIHRWMGSLAVDRNGDMALGYSASSATLNPDIRYAGRLATDPLNTLAQGETTMLPGVIRGTQTGNCGGSTCHRWGDYSAMTLDTDGCTFWYTTEYYETSGLNWQTRIGSFKFAQCTPLDITPPTATNESGTTDENVAVPITLQGSDPEMCELTFSIVSGSSNGTLGSIADNACIAGSPNTDTGSLTYTPNAGFHGSDSFTYKVNDGTFDSNIATVSITVIASYDLAVLADAPAAYWRLGEASGATAVDATGNGHAGTYQNAPTLGAPGLISGGDTAVSFDGVDDRVLVADSASLSPTSAVTVEAWVRGASLASSSGGYRTIVLKTNSYWLRIDNVSGVQRARFFIRHAGIYYGVTATGITLTTGTTFHLVGTYDGTTLRIYVNGVERGSATHLGVVDDTTNSLLISNPPGSAWSGRIDEVAVYGNALSAARVQTHYTIGAPPSADYGTLVLADSPAAYWRLGETSGVTAVDATGNGNAGTYQNAPTLAAPGLITGGNTAVSFDGVNDRVLAPDSTSLSPIGAVSVEAWVRGASFASSSGGYRTIAMKWNSYWLRVDNVSGIQRARFFVRDTATYYGVTATGVTIATGTTYHLVGTYDGATLRIYVNGVERGSAVHSGAVDDTSAAVQISSSSGFTWDGRLDEIALYGSALPLSEVREHYSQGLIG